MDPYERFRRWWEEARTAMGEDADAMTVATAGADGLPSARTVILRGFDERGFTFFTNLRSRKARELAHTPHAALLLHWAPLARQVRIEGRAERTSREEDERVWLARPVGHRLASWASPQSEPIESRETLIRDRDEALRRFGDDVPLPDHWGGYRVRAERIEFWQGKEHRLHDRLLFVRDGEGWTERLLAP